MRTTDQWQLALAKSLLAMDEPQRQLAKSMLEGFQAAAKAAHSLKKPEAARAVLEGWYEDLLDNFVGELGLNDVRLVQAHEERQLPILAYIARNLLELAVWIEYCCKSTENARRFAEDMYRDGVGLHRAIKSIVSLFPSVPAAGEIGVRLENFEETVRKRAEEFGVSSVDDDYKRVVHAAEEVGMRVVFTSLNTVLSKLCHPTAIVVLTFPQGRPLDDLCNGFFSFGALLSMRACDVVTAFVQGRRTSSAPPG